VTDLIESIDKFHFIYALIGGFISTLIAVYIIRWFFHLSVFWLIASAIIFICVLSPMLLMSPPTEYIQNPSLQNLPILKPYGLVSIITFLGAIAAYQFSRKELY